ncbi:phage antirepressor [Burkholderia anthina]|uniref:phage antirepressor n=1 Tax=Burkholderia anthina TaxID=179879 RepID=UPI001588EE97|nr:phage antirepressor [Burkholderia anthina]
MILMSQFVFDASVIRVIPIEGEPWFVARDVATVLGYADPTNAIKLHCRGVAKYHPLQTPGGPQQTRLIPERDVYRLVMRSKLPAAERFEEWVVGEVLPSIRKTGAYIATAVALPNFSDPVAAARAWADAKEAERQAIAALADAAPKAAALERFATATEGSFCFREAAKALRMKPTALMAWLVNIRWVYRHQNGRTWLGYQPRLDAGWLEHKIVSGQRTNGPDWGNTQVRVTAKGIARLALLLERSAAAAPLLAA